MEGDETPSEVPANVLLAAETLLQLPLLIQRQAVSGNKLYLRWGAKRKRGTRSPPNIAAAAVSYNLRPSPSKKIWTDASSPDTPLIVSYSGDNVDPKSSSAAATAPRKKSVKMTREDLRRAETEAHRENDILKEEINLLKRKIDWEICLNLRLKRAQKQLFTGQPKEKKGQWVKQVNTRLTLGVPSAEVLCRHVALLEPSIPNQAAVIGPDDVAATQPIRPSVALLNFGSDRVLVPVLDLNLPVPADDNGNSPPQDDPIRHDGRTLNRAAAEARMRRHYIMKSKLRRKVGVDI